MTTYPDDQAQDTTVDIATVLDGIAAGTISPIAAQTAVQRVCPNAGHAEVVKVLLAYLSGLALTGDIRKQHKIAKVLADLQE